MSDIKDHNNTTESSGIAIYKDWLVLISTMLIIGLDQLTKYLVREFMNYGQSIPETGFFRLTYYTNSGTIFGLFPNIPIIFTIASVIAIACLIYFYKTQKMGGVWLRVSIALLLGGAIGNFIDRVSMGEVTDFIDVGMWPVFNIADSSITCGIFLLILVTVVLPELGKSKPSRDIKSDSDHS
ncbi:MAG: signal peptidase II [Dehalococcoidia bacterium]|nr:signal peptidase II [Dehalococcoidia bacterium]MQG16134.1 signal peptidase II [SAR202 cluster bacterium]|tara:strand:- start:125 stop:670 length:546 start_codon:yes stop_codon:yes gene_type:complete